MFFLTALKGLYSNTPPSTPPSQLPSSSDTAIEAHDYINLNLPNSSSSSDDDDEKATSSSLAKRTVYLINAQDDNGNTKLHKMIVMENKDNEIQLKKNLESIAKLLRQGANPNIQNNDGDTPLHLVGKLPFWNWYHSNIVDLLLKHKAKVDIANNKKITALHQVINGRACTATVHLLIEKGAYVNAQNLNGDTPLHLLAQHPQHLFSDPFNTENAALLLAKGAEVNSINRQGNTPLHLALQSKRETSAIVFLLNSGADLNILNAHSETPMHILISYNSFEMPNQEEVIKIFLEKGARIDPSDIKEELSSEKVGKGPCSKTIALLKSAESGSGIIKDPMGRTDLHIAAQDSEINKEEFKKIFEHSKDKCVRDNSGNTALHLAAESGSFEIVKILIEGKLPVDSTNNKGETPLFPAVRRLLHNEFQSICTGPRLREFDEIMSMLYGGTLSSLHLKTSLGREREIIALLLKYQANPNHKNGAGQSVIVLCDDWRKRHTQGRNNDYFNHKQPI